MDDTILLSIFCLAMMTHIFLRPRPPPPPPTLPLTPSIICHHDCEIGRAERGLEDRVKRAGGAPRSAAQEKNLYGEGHTKPEKKVGDRANITELCTIYQRQRRSFKFLTTSVTSFGPYEGIVEALSSIFRPNAQIDRGEGESAGRFFFVREISKCHNRPCFDRSGAFRAIRCTVLTLFGRTTRPPKINTRMGT